MGRGDKGLDGMTVGRNGRRGWKWNGVVGGGDKKIGGKVESKRWR